MSLVCQVTAKRPMSGNNVSHANNKTKRRFKPNIHVKKFWHPGESRWITLKVSTKGIRIIYKKGIESVVNMLRAKGQKV